MSYFRLTLHLSSLFLFWPILSSRFVAFLDFASCPMRMRHERETAHFRFERRLPFPVATDSETATKKFRLTESHWRLLRNGGCYIHVRWIRIHSNENPTESFPPALTTTLLFYQRIPGCPDAEWKAGRLGGGWPSSAQLLTCSQKPCQELRLN